MIYDCFTFFNELELLELRLAYLDKYVDRFVLSESTKTHSGENKSLVFLSNKARFKRYEHKITHIIADNFPKFNSSWTYENYQRNELIKGLSKCQPEDIILISDIDEIPNIKNIPKDIKDGNVYCFLQEMYFFYVNNYKSNQLIWEGGTKATSFRTILNNLIDEDFVKYSEPSFPKELNRDTTFTKIRLYRNLQYINNGGWHFSYMGGVKRISAKLSSFSHQEFNKSTINSERYIKECLDKGIYLLEPSIRCYIKDPKHFPTEFLKILPSDFFIDNSRKQNLISYKLRKMHEIFLICLRNKFRYYLVRLKFSYTKVFS